MSDTNGYMFRISDPRPVALAPIWITSSMTHLAYWKGVGEARQIVEACPTRRNC